jgi:DNA polymerase-3 subunit alpha
VSDFVHLHVHSNLSFRDSINVIEDTAKRAAFLGQEYLALTDHGHAFGSVRHAYACRDAQIKPIFGMEAYEALVSDVADGPDDDRYPAHLTLLVTNETGWRNFCAIHSLSHQEPYAQRRGPRLYPRVDRKMLEKYNEGLICMSACLGGKVQRPYLDDNKTDDQYITKEMDWYREVFEDRFYVELMGNTSDQRGILHHQRQICKKAKVRTVATNDVHYLTQDQGEEGGPHHVYSCSRFGNEPLHNRSPEDRNYGWYMSDEFYLKSADEMYDTGFTADEITTSLEIAERCTASGFSPLTDLNFGIPPAPLDDIEDEMLFNMWQSSDQRVL